MTNSINRINSQFSLVRMKNIFLLLFFFTCLVNETRATTQSDSLIEEIKTITSTPKRLDTYLSEANSYYDYNTIISIELLFVALKENNVESYPKQMAYIYSLLGVSLAKEGYLALSDHYFLLAEKKVRKLNDPRLTCSLYLDKSTALQRSWSVYDEDKILQLKENYDFAINLIESHDLKKLKGRATSIMAIYHSLKGNPEQAESKLRSILGMPEQDRRFQAKILCNLGLVKFNNKDLDSAMYYFQRCTKFSEEFNLKFMELYCAAVTSDLYLEQGKSELALQHAERCYELAQELGWLKGMASATENRIRQSIKDENIQKMRYYHKQRERISDLRRQKKKQFDNFLIAEIESNLSNYTNRSESMKAENEQMIANSSIWFTIICITAFLIILSLVWVLLNYRRLKILKNVPHQKNDYSAQLNAQQLEIIQKNQQISCIHGEIKEITKSIYLLSNEHPNSSFIKETYLKVKGLNKKLLRNNNWKEFLKTFRDTYPNFEKNLLDQFPRISGNDLKMAIYIRAGLSTVEISELKGITVEGTRTAMKRLEKKLNVSNKQELQVYLNNF